MFFVDNSYLYLKNNSILKNQFNLYKRFKFTNLSLQEYFNEQEIIDKNQRKNAKEIKWEDLKKNDLKTYSHEIEHFSVFKKYKITSTLFKENKINGLYFVMDMDSMETSKREKYDKKKVIEVLSEMLIAPYKNGSSLFNCVLDIIYYEVLIGNLKQINLGEFRLKLKKYETNS
jgi:hypothetical protein